MRPPAPATPRFGVGAVLELAERDYLYGLGTLAVRLTVADVDPSRYRNIEWVNASGVQVHPDGTTGEERYVTIRVSAIASALRAADWRPPHYPRTEIEQRR